MVEFLVSAISFSTIFLFGCVGEIITEKSGHLNLGIPGIMGMGTFGGCFGVASYMNCLSDPSKASYILLLLCAIVCAMFFASIGGAIYAVMTVTLRCNQNITGLAITTFGAGFTDYFMSSLNTDNFSAASKLLRTSLPFADSLGWFGKIFLSHGILVYIGIVIAILVALFLKRTKKGLNLQAVGENPATADAVGINVKKYKYGAILIGSGIAGIGGMFYIMDYSSGSWQNSDTIAALGWLAIALVIFAMWKPDLAILGSFIFGLLYVVVSYSYSALGITLSLAQKDIVKLLPYVITIVVLIVTSIIGKKETQPPASLGINYYREER